MTQCLRMFSTLTSAAELAADVLLVRLHSLDSGGRSQLTRETIFSIKTKSKQVYSSLITCIIKVNFYCVDS